MYVTTTEKSSDDYRQRPKTRTIFGKLKNPRGHSSDAWNRGHIWENQDMW